MMFSNSLRVGLWYGLWEVNRREVATRDDARLPACEVTPKDQELPAARITAVRLMQV